MLFVSLLNLLIQEEAQHSASITSEELEKKYLEDNNAVIEFTAGIHTYELSMQGLFVGTHFYSCML